MKEIETIQDPKPQKRYEWRCINTDCAAKLAGVERLAKSITMRAGQWELHFECPHCSWQTTVPK